MSSNFSELFTNYRAKELKTLKDIAELNKVLYHVLKDHKLDSLANQIGEKLFELQANEEEFSKFVVSNPEVTMKFMLDLLSKKDKENER